jgi:hypothetical protein
MQKKDSKSGQKPGRGEPVPPEQTQGRKTEVREEDIFGGAERVRRGETVKSPNTKP